MAERLVFLFLSVVSRSAQTAGFGRVSLTCCLEQISKKRRNVFDPTNIVHDWERDVTGSCPLAPGPRARTRLAVACRCYALTPSSWRVIISSLLHGHETM